MLASDTHTTMKRCPGSVSKRPLTQVSEKCDLQMLLCYMEEETGEI